MLTVTDRYGPSQAALLLLCLWCTEVSADGHGVFCTTQFNYWFSNNASAESTLLSLVDPYEPCLTACNMQDNANAKYTQYVAAGGLGYPNAGGFNQDCSAPDSSVGVPAGGCAFSYPVVANSTCRLKIFGADETKELQWCMPSLTSTMKIGTSDSRRHGDDELLSCPQHTAFDVTGGTEPYETRAVLFDKFANTLVSICAASTGAKSEGCGDKLSSGEKAGIAIASVVGVLGMAAVGSFAVSFTR